MGNFVWSWFLKSQGKGYIMAAVGAFGALLMGPALSPLLVKVGITVTKVALENGGIGTNILIDHNLAAAGLLALAATLPNFLRVLAAKHPKSTLPENVKKVL